MLERVKDFAKEDAQESDEQTGKEHSTQNYFSKEVRKVQDWLKNKRS